MSFGEKLQTWTGVVKNFFIIGGIVLAVLWMGLSIYANFTEKDTVNGPKTPEIAKARYEFYIYNTGQFIYSMKFEHPSDTVYILKSNYSVVGNKYRYFDKELTLDETYFGDITVRDRLSGSP